uniref:Uncharacterized protein n=1 Tax=Stegastes partitus TaxID=144197 RepID=A0A3B4ZNI0_9TELE
MAEDHGLSDGDGSIDVTESLELLLLAVAQHVVLFDGIQCLFFSLQLDDVGIWHNALSKQHLAVFRKHPHKNFNLFGVNKLEFTTPVQHGTRCPNYYLFLQFHASLTFISSNGIDKLDLGIMFSHLLNHLSSLKCQFICKCQVLGKVFYRFSEST